MGDSLEETGSKLLRRNERSTKRSGKNFLEEMEKFIKSPSLEEMGRSINLSLEEMGRLIVSNFSEVSTFNLRVNWYFDIICASHNLYQSGGKLLTLDF